MESELDVLWGKHLDRDHVTSHSTDTWARSTVRWIRWIRWIRCWIHWTPASIQWHHFRCCNSSCLQGSPQWIAAIPASYSSCPWTGSSRSCCWIPRQRMMSTGTVSCWMLIAIVSSNCALWRLWTASWKSSTLHYPNQSQKITDILRYLFISVDANF